MTPGVFINFDTDPPTDSHEHTISYWEQGDPQAFIIDTDVKVGETGGSFTLGNPAYSNVGFMVGFEEDMGIAPQILGEVTTGQLYFRCDFIRADGSASTGAWLSTWCTTWQEPGYGPWISGTIGRADYLNGGVPYVSITTDTDGASLFSYSLPVATFVSLAIYVEGTSIKAYADGVLLGTKTISAAIPSGTQYGRAVLSGVKADIWIDNFKLDFNSEYIYPESDTDGGGGGGDGGPTIILDIPINTCDIILENPLRSRFVRPPFSSSSVFAPWTNMYPSPGTPSITGLDSVVEDTVLNPFGLEALLYTPTGTATSTHYMGKGISTDALISGQGHQCEVYIKESPSTYHYRLRISLQAANEVDTIQSNVDATFDLATGTTSIPTVIGAGWSSVFLNITSVGSGWWKLVLKGNFTPTAGESAVSSQYFLLDETGEEDYIAGTLGGVYMYAPQLYTNTQPDEVIGDSYTDVDANAWFWNGYAWYLPYANAKTIRLVSSAQTFTFDSGGSLSPGTQYIRFDILRQNTTATCTWTTSPSVDVYSASTGGSPTTSGNTVYLRSADFAANTSVTVTASVTDGITLTESTKVIKVQASSGLVTGYLTNRSVLIAASSDGLSYSLTGGTGLMKVFLGIVDEASSAVFSITTSGNASTTQNGLTVSAEGSGLYISEGGTWTTGEEVFDIIGEYGGTAITDTFTVTKVNAVAKVPVVSQAVAVTLSKDSATVLCDTLGDPVSYSGTSTDISVYEGTTFYTYTSGTPGPGQFNLSGSVASGITMGSVTASTSGNNRAIIADASAMTTNPADITLNINIKSLTGSDLILSKVMTIVKAIPVPPAARSSVITSIDITSATVWSNTSAADAIFDIGMGIPIQGDIVTEYNGAAGFAETRVRTAISTWITVSNLIAPNAVTPNTYAPINNPVLTGSLTLNGGSVFASTGYSLGVNGYQKYTDGSNYMIDQWCEEFVANADNDEVTITYPYTTMTNSHAPRVSLVDPGLDIANSSNFLGYAVKSYTDTGCVVTLGQNGGGARDVTVCINVKGEY